MAPAGSMLGRRYELLEQIGAGGYSEVWRGTDLVLARQVAIKLLHLGYAQHDEVITRFRAEAQHAGRLSHENIARVYDYGEPDWPQPPFLVMEYVDGPTLAGALASGPLDPARTLDIVAQTAAGLNAAHNIGLVHRDIKPGNLLLAPGGIVKITDFGIAHAADSAPVTCTGQLVGTPGYLAPERAMGASATPASDLYSLGIVAYECLTGAPPFTGPALAVALAHRERPMPPLPGWVPADVAAFVMALTAKKPGDRPRSAGEVARRASYLASRLVAAAAAQPGIPPADPALTVAEQTARYPGTAVAVAATAPDPDTQDLPLPAAVAPPVYTYGPAALPGRTARPTAPRRGRVRGRPNRLPGSRPPGRLRRRAVLPFVAAALLIAAAFLIGSANGPGPAPHAGTVPSASPPGPFSPVAQVTTVLVKKRPLIGQPVTVAASQLRKQGLSVHITWRRSSAEPAGTVLSVRPAGPRPVGSTVTLAGALPPPPQVQNADRSPVGGGEGHGQHKRHGDDHHHGDG